MLLNLIIDFFITIDCWELNNKPQRMNYFHFKNIWKTISYQWFNPTREGWGLQFSTCYKNANAFLNSMYGKYLACLWLLPSSLFTVTLEEVDNWLQLPVWGDKMPLQKAFQHKILGSYYQSHDIWSYSNSYLPCLSRLSDSLKFSPLLFIFLTNCVSFDSNDDAWLHKCDSHYGKTPPDTSKRHAIL